MSNKVGIDPQSDYEETKVPPKNGKKLIDERLRSGPLAERGCTDILCLLLFIANVAVLVYHKPSY